MTSAAARLNRIRDDIAAAARLAGRDPADVQLVAVTKGRAMDEIAPLIAAGHRDFGESRVQEALSKWPPMLARHPDLRLHEIGRLQSNKAAEAVALFDTVHSVDRASLFDSLVREVAKAGRSPDIYIQVNIGEEEQKGGCAIADLADLVEAAKASPLTLKGLMAIPPAGLEPGPFFALLAKLARRHDVTGLSMGMSSDFKAAVVLGATAVRVGTALFDDR
ncbi:MAG: YggS family pyridoxal phosphate-dependent enzyme [Sphingomicrobium sp.]